jgi:hypothetical protein
VQDKGHVKYQNLKLDECCMGGRDLLHGQIPTAAGGGRARPDGL